MFKFVLGHSKAWLFYNRFLLCLKSVHIEKNRSTTLALRFAVWRSPNPSVAACISSNKFDSLHSNSILFFSLVSKSFKVISLFSYQGCLFCSCQAAFVLYQSFHRLSRTFLNYFLLCFSTFFSVVRDSLFILSSQTSVVNTFFQFFTILYSCLASYIPIPVQPAL